MYININYVIQGFKNSNSIIKSANKPKSASIMKSLPRKPVTRSRKKLPKLQQQEQQTSVQLQSEPTFHEIQQSNSQLSVTLSTGFQPKEIICREQQKNIISKFIRDCLATQGIQNSRVLYISGVPGVGKTVSTMQIVNKVKKNISHKKAIFRYFNAMTLTTPTQIYTLINKQLYKPQKNDIRQNPPVKLTLKFKQDKRVKILIIDEIDFLYTKNQNILYNLFEWCNSPDTKLCTIIIANTMDFPQRLQPKLTSRMGQNRLVFKPYSQAEVQKIIQDRLMKSNRFNKGAIIYACKKMSSFTSDVRKLLDVLRRALQINSTGTITTQDMCKCWKQCAEETGQGWQEQLPQFYRNILNIIKQLGGVCLDSKILQRMCFLQKYNKNQLQMALKQMEQMSLVRMKEKKVKYLMTYEITLLKI